ncbi:hypothetical protein BsWGS_13767 [Bradybaena similaris]
MKHLKAGKLFGLKNNSTAAPAARGEHLNGGVYTNAESDFEKSGQAASISVSVIVAVAVLGLCGLLAYRQIYRRRKQAWASHEKARKEFVRQAVRLKLQELGTAHDCTPWLEHKFERKRSSVTFGDVIVLNPSENTENSPVPERRKHDGNDEQHQVYRQIHHHIVYGGSKRRNRHSPYRRDQQQVSYRLQEQARRLQSQLNVDDNDARDNKIRMYRDSDHHRYSVDDVEPRAQHAREPLVNSTDILNMPKKDQCKLRSDKIECGSEVLIDSKNTVMMPNKDHHTVLLDSKVEPTTERDRKAPINSRDVIMMPAKGHHKLLDTKVEQSTEHDPDVFVSSRDTAKMPNKDHHKLSLPLQLEPSPERREELSANSKGVIQILNTDHHKLLLHGQIKKTTGLAREVPSNSKDIIKMPNKDHHKLSLHKKLEPATERGREVRRSSTNTSQVYVSLNSNGNSTVSTNLPQSSRISSSRTVVLHKGNSRGTVKRSSAVVPISVDAVY